MTARLQQVAGFIEEHGEVTLEDLMPNFPAMDRKQIMQALKNAKAQGLVRLVKRGNAKAKRKGIWGPPLIEPPPKLPRPTRRYLPIASVWDLGQEPRLGAWPPRFVGGREYLLGE